MYPGKPRKFIFGEYDKKDQEEEHELD